MNELRELFRLANISVAITIPILLAGAILLRNANEGLLQAFAMAGVLLPFAIFLALDERNKRRRRRGQ
ncbi:MAG TPA: hypothetical protein VFR04_04965 [Solirubrobacterales bacterium]|nr:hypothetical protein [Solirubrobacterales bacterium]